MALQFSCEWSMGTVGFLVQLFQDMWRRIKDQDPLLYRSGSEL